MAIEISSELERADYPAIWRWLHWLIAGLIVLQFFLAEFAERAAASESLLEQLGILANHKSVGITILALAVLRLLIRFFMAKPELPLSMSAWEVRVSRLSHFALYGFLFGVPLTGWLMSSASAYSVSWFGLYTLPDLIEPSEALKGSFAMAHEWLGKGLFVVALIHVLAAFKHHWLDKDDVMASMSSPGTVLWFVAAILLGVFVLTDIGGASVATEREPPAAVADAQPNQEAEAEADSAPPTVPNVEPEATAEPEAQPAPIQELSSGPRWDVDLERSEIRFTGEQAGAAFDGIWREWSADIVFDATNLDSALFDVQIRIDSVDTQDKDRDATLMDAAWFDAASDPSVRYVAENFRQNLGDSYVAEGELTAKGVSTPVPLEFTVTEEGDQRVIQGTARIDRLAAGLGSGEWEDTEWVGQFVDVSVEVRAPR